MMMLTKQECEAAWAFYGRHGLQQLLDSIVRQYGMSDADREDAAAHVRAEFPAMLRGSEPRKPRAWATTAFRRAIRRWLRNRRREASSTAPLEIVPEMMAPAADPGREAALRVLLPVLERLVLQLPSKERFVVHGLLYRHRRLADLVREVGEPHSTLASRRNSGFVNLAAALRRERRSDPGLETAYRLLRGHYY